MNVVCIFPITYHPENYFEIVTYFTEKIVPKLNILGARAEIKFAGTDYIFVPTNQSISMQGQQKGEGILECLKNCGDIPDCVIVCDGSGAIPYDYIVDLFQELVSDLSICGVLANRGKNKAISDERFLIEQFEIFTLKKYHNYTDNIPDGQCGLWRYKTSPKCINGCNKKITITAKSYEVELDLLSELLENQMKFSFIEVELPERKVTSSFTFEKNMNKMKFLLNKYPRLKDCIPSYISEFESLPENLSKSRIIKDMWEKYKIEIKKII